MSGRPRTARKDDYCTNWPRRHGRQPARGGRLSHDAPDAYCAEVCARSVGSGAGRRFGRPTPRSCPGSGMGLAATTLGAYLAVTSAVELRVRFVSGDFVDVKYESAHAVELTEIMEEVVSTLAQDTGTLSCRHGDRVLVLFGRGVAALEISPRGAVL